MTDEADLAPPGDEFVRHRWIPARIVEWVKQADAIMVEHGVVHGRVVHERRNAARWRAEKLIRLMVELRLHDRWELRQHIERKPGGYIWSVEYLGEKRNTAARNLRAVSGGET